MERQMTAFDVFLNGVRIDTVFFNSDDTDEVQRCLVEYDHYDPDIQVKNVEKVREPA